MFGYTPTKNLREYPALLPRASKTARHLKIGQLGILGSAV